MRLAALDLGSNTFLLLIADLEEGKIKKILADEIRIVRLAQGVGQTGKFHQEALERAKDCFREYDKIIHSLHVDRTLAVATSAARDAENKDLFFELARKFHIPVEIITGAREAELTYLGTVFDQDPHQDYVIVDVGGGSTEIIGQGPQGEIKGWSTDVGSVRLTERFITKHPIAPEELRKMNEHVRMEFAKVRNEIPSPQHQKIIAVAGTPTTLAQLELKDPEFIEDRIHGHILTNERIAYWRDRLAGMSIEERQALPGMPPKRADVLVAGCSILYEALSLMGESELKVSTKGVRYGLALLAGRKT